MALGVIEVHSRSVDEMRFIFVVTDQIQGNVRVNAIIAGQGVAVVTGVTVAAGATAVDVVTAAADPQHQRSRREVVLAATAEPEEVGLEAGKCRKEVERALTARPDVAVQAARRNLRETDRRVVTRAKGVAQTVVADQRRVDQEVLRSQRRADQEAVMNVRKVVLLVVKKLPEVVLPVMRSHAKVDQEVLRVLSKGALVVAAGQNSLKRMAERVVVVRLVLVKKRNVEVVHLVETKSQTDEIVKMILRQSILHTRGAVAIHVALLNRSLIEVVQLVVKRIASLPLVT